MGQASFRLDDDIENWIESRLIAGQNKSVWYRHAVETMMYIDPVLDEIYEPYQYDERQELIEAAIQKEVERRKNGVNNPNGN
ncbi:hypothetical protein C2R22_10805 [Salinigranum rubrum]|uniref:Uncharacterized protein n=1 Tax=Salinigranum rubrum TaxID=755307 RepID=A0A2I8VJH8_9EURY|nr:hypothetical protein [Salinigranum rubrum]AUV82078.1 hypothetical protein C2R22_10805 [Salinigranum rubrum]